MAQQKYADDLTFHAIKTFLDEFCRSNLFEESLRTAYSYKMRQLLSDLAAQKTIFSGKAQGWAAGVATAVLQVNRLRGFSVHLQAVSDAFSVSNKTRLGRAYDIGEILGNEVLAGKRYDIHETSQPLSGDDQALRQALVGQLSDLFPVEMAEVMPQDMQRMVAKFQSALDELALHNPDFSIEDVRTLVADLGVDLISEDEFNAILKTNPNIKEQVLLAMADVPEQQAKITSVTITAVKVPKEKELARPMTLKEMEPISQMLH